MTESTQSHDLGSATANFEDAPREQSSNSGSSSPGSSSPGQLGPAGRVGRESFEPYSPPYRRLNQRSGFLAGILSAVIPGLGNVYNGLVQRGLTHFAVAVCLFFAAISSEGSKTLALILPSLVFVWMFGILDAVRQASLINHGVTEADLPSVTRTNLGGGLAVGIALFLIGTYGLLSTFFDFDLTWLVEHWYLLLMAFGGWLIFNALRQRQSAEAAADTADSLGAL